MNRRMRNRMSGGVGGRRGRPCLLPDMCFELTKTGEYLEITTVFMYSSLSSMKSEHEGR